MYLRLAKNAFAIQNVLHHFIIQVTLFLLVRIFPLNFSFYLHFYNYLFLLSWGNIFLELKFFFPGPGFGEYWLLSIGFDYRVSSMIHGRCWTFLSEA